MAKNVKKQMEMFDEGGLSTAKDDAMDKLDSGVEELRAERKQQFDKMTEMLTSGKVNDMTLEQKENFVQLYKMLKQHHNFAEGGLLEDGGLMDEGGTVDPVSGNDVPPGSTQEEVRDDIPAQLSEGEFVLPADVVRYHGLDKIMALRDEAKMGLARMEAMGQMGNADEATLPDDIPFDINDLDIEEEDEYNYQVGGYVPGQYSGQGYGTYTLPGTGVIQQQPSYLSTYGQQVSQQQPMDYGIYNVPSQQQFRPATYTPEPYTGPRFEDVIPSPTGAYDELRRYVNAQGQVRMIPFVDGKPLYPIPQGFYPQEEAVADIMPSTTVGQTRVADTRGGDGDERPIIGGRTQEEIQSGISEMKDRYSITGSRGMDLLSALPGGNIIKTIAGPSGITLGQKEPAAISEAPPGYQREINARRAKFESILGTGITGYAGYEKGDLDPVTGGVFDSRGRAINEDGSGAVGSTGTRSYNSLQSLRDDLAAGTESGWRGGPISESKYNSLSDTGRANYDKYAEITGAKSHKSEPAPSRPQVVSDTQRTREQQQVAPVVDEDKQRAEQIDAAQRASEERAAENARQAAAQRAAGERRQEVEQQRDRTPEQNKAAADREARERTGNSRSTAVTDSKGNAVRDSGGNVVTNTPPSGGGGDDPGGGRWCCSQMVHHGLWSHKHEFARLTVWSKNQPNWWRSGYNVWGKVIAKTLLRKKGFWSDVMQSFYDYHIAKKSYTWKTALAHVVIYPGAFICGHIWRDVPTVARFAEFEELNS